MLVALKENFVAAHDTCVLVDTVVEASAQVDDVFHAVGREKRVTENFVALLSDTVHTSCTLDKPDDSPRQVEIDDNVRILQVLTLAEHVGGNQNACLLALWNGGIVALGRKLFYTLQLVGGVACYHVDIFDAALLQLLVDIVSGVGILGKHQHFVVLVVLTQHSVEHIEFWVVVWLPRTAKFYHREKNLAVGFEGFFERGLKKLGTQPLDIVLT